MNLLEQLRKMSIVVADTGQINAIRKHKPQDATTNPSLLLKAAQDEQYADLVDEAVDFGSHQSGDENQRLDAVIEKLFVNFGSAILDIIPGRVSTEVDARLSFDINGSIAKGKRYIKLYEDRGIDRQRILVKLASTWEGMQAAQQLEREGIHCNMTLMFALVQAAAAAQANATLISPFVGRITDWHKANRNVKDIPIAEDPGPQSVKDIYSYLKKYDYPVQVMGASFRKYEQITELAGCDLLTIAPDLLEELQSLDGRLDRKLDAAAAKRSKLQKLDVTQERFRWMLNEDQMATEKLSDGIRKFHSDQMKLRQYVAKRVTVGA